LVPPENQIPDGFFIRDITRWIFLKTDLPASAFPSISSLLLCFIGYLTYQNIRPLFKYVLPLAILTLVASVYLKLHYAVDVIAGLLSFPAFYWISSRTYYWINNLLGGNIHSLGDLFYSIPKAYGKR
jgi:membrane-associated phospholipid phosphatase